MSNLDLKQLGHIVLKYMNGWLWKDLCKVDFIKQQRAKNRVFGLEQPDKWSGDKVLINFLKELFNTKKPAIVKLDKLVCCISFNICRLFIIKAFIYITV